MDDYRAIAQQYATQFGIPADLFMRQIQAESAWDPTALSPAGAIGLGQLMPTTAQELGVDIMNPQDNLYGAAKYLRQMYDRFGDWRTALAAYNAGPGRVEQYGGIPPFEETQNYVSSILDEQDVRGGQTMPTMPQEQRPSGLLEMMGVQRQGTGGPQGDLPFYQRDRFKDFAGRLAMAANTLSQRPDPTVPQVVLGAQQSRKANRTAEWLAQQPGGEMYAQAILAGANPGEIIAKYRTEAAAIKSMQAGKIMEVDGQLIRVMPDGSVTELWGAGAGDFEDVSKLRKEYVARDEVEQFNDLTRQYSNIVSSASLGTGAGDIGLVFSYMKMLDPTSSVQQGEQANAQNAAGIPSAVRGIYNQIVGGGSLDDPARDQFVAAATDFYSNAQQQVQPISDYYRSLARAAGYDEEQVVKEFGYAGEEYVPWSVRRQNEPELPEGGDAEEADAPTISDTAKASGITPDEWGEMTPEERALFP